MCVCVVTMTGYQFKTVAQQAHLMELLQIFLTHYLSKTEKKIYIYIFCNNSEPCVRFYFLKAETAWILRENVCSLLICKIILE